MFFARQVAEQAARSVKRWERYASTVEDLIVSHSEVWQRVESTKKNMHNEGFDYFHLRLLLSINS